MLPPVSQILVVYEGVHVLNSMHILSATNAAVKQKVFNLELRQDLCFGVPEF